MSCDVVWFKRDLRLRDHRPLRRALERGPVICLYIYDPVVLESEEFGVSDLRFINQCLEALERSLRARGGALVTRVGKVVSVLQSLHREVGIERLWSHEETGSFATYERDKAVARWASSLGVEWVEIPQFGVFRPHGDRDGWAHRWRKRMALPVVEAPARIDVVDGVDSHGLCGADRLGVWGSPKPDALKGGESRAWDLLEGFLGERGQGYRWAMSKPGPSRDSCSRLSPYLAHGAISMRATYQRLKAVREELKRQPQREDHQGWSKSLSSFESRLWWHCHFIQKLEDEPELEFRNMSRAYDGMRREVGDPSRLKAWKAGETGYPMIDACIKELHRSGWITFRMRAMLVSFASYHLWLHWRQTGPYLGRHFLDFEPGIHWPQMQMQSGTTGINAIRIYNPIKQGEEHDAEGNYVKDLLPALKRVPVEFVHAPWRMTARMQEAFGCVIGVDYPAPIVGHKLAYHRAKERVWAVKESRQAKAEAKRVYARHGSRRRSRWGG